MLLGRLDYLSTTLGGAHQLLVLVSRLPPLPRPAAAAAAAAAPAGGAEHDWGWARRSVLALNRAFAGAAGAGGVWAPLSEEAVLSGCRLLRPGLGAPAAAEFDPDDPDSLGIFARPGPQINMRA